MRPWLKAGLLGGGVLAGLTLVSPLWSKLPKEISLLVSCCQCVPYLLIYPLTGVLAAYLTPAPYSMEQEAKAGALAGLVAGGIEGVADLFITLILAVAGISDTSGRGIAATALCIPMRLIWSVAAAAVGGVLYVVYKNGMGNAKADGLRIGQNWAALLGQHPTASSNPYSAAPSNRRPTAQSNPYPTEQSDPYPTAPSNRRPTVQNNPYSTAKNDPYLTEQSDSYPTAPSNRRPTVQSDPYLTEQSDSYPTAPSNRRPTVQSDPYPAALSDQRPMARSSQRSASLSIRTLRERIVWLAAAFDDHATFQERAQSIADEFGPKCIGMLPHFFHNDPEMPPELAEQFQRSGSWTAARQAAVFEILYYLGAAAFPLLGRLAFGPYDWTKTSAIGILCRLGIDGIERDQIAAELAADLPNWRYEDIGYTIDDLARFAPYAPPLLDALYGLARKYAEDNPAGTLEIVEPLARHAPAIAKEFAELLRYIMRDKGRDIRNPLADGQAAWQEDEVGKKSAAARSGPSYPSIPDYHAICAALILHRLFPGDDETLANLYEWAAKHPDRQLRQEITEYLQSANGR